MLEDRGNTTADLARVRTRLASLDAERSQLQRELEVLEARLTSEHASVVHRTDFENAPVTNTSLSHEKVGLFRRLFAGRPDVFPVRWESSRSGRSGYSPACFNEWVKGICGKPKVKYRECPHQKFVPPDAGIIERGLCRKVPKSPAHSGRGRSMYRMLTGRHNASIASSKLAETRMSASSSALFG